MIEIENLLKMAEEIEKAEEKYSNTKIELECLKAQYILKNDWEKVLNKTKVSQKEKDAYVEVETEVLKRKVKKLERELKYKKMIYEIHMVEIKNHMN